MEENKIQMQAFIEFIISKMLEKNPNSIASVLKDIPQIYSLSVKDVVVEISKKMIRVEFPFDTGKLIIEEPSK